MKKFTADNLICMTPEDKAFMQAAIKMSEDNVISGNGGPFGAVVVKNGKIIGRGFNRVTATNDPTAHAEIMAIREACAHLKNFQLENCEIYTSCEPCPMCLGAIYWARPAKIFYANSKEDAADINFDDQFIYEELERPIEKRRLFTQQMMRDEALQAFKLWADSTKKIDY
ncbi:MAG: nucleoside deaminase [Reichenbachiella sp.]|uniref:nucleoside deaminase n=1 Tax=Reichenbachiella sp. TaxID=2184521 RepID=UPI003263D54C